MQIIPILILLVSLYFGYRSLQTAKKIKENEKEINDIVDKYHMRESLKIKPHTDVYRIVSLTMIVGVGVLIGIFIII